MGTISRRDFIPLVGLTVLGASSISAISDDETGKVLSIKPPALKKGDLVGICAPAGCISDPGELTEFIDVLKDQGFTVKCGRNVKGRKGYFSASDEERAAEFMEMITDKEIKAIFFVRGGWGSARILPFLDFGAIRNNPKVIMGFSDISTLLNAISFKTGLITFHGPNGNASWNSRTMTYFHSLMVHREKMIFRNRPEDMKTRMISTGSAEGELYGGNLTVISSLIGTPFLPDWKGKILFLEDLKEEPYRIDRMLTQLKLSGVLNEVKGIVLGAFRDCEAEEPDRAFTVDEVFDQHFKKLSIPVYSGAQVGHVVNKFILPVGIRVRLNADLGTIEMLETAVS